MAASATSKLSPLAIDVAEGLSLAGQKRISPHYFYDALGSSLFEAITLLPEYGLARADERLLRRYASDIAAMAGNLSIVSELGSGTGKKTKFILEGILAFGLSIVYRPIDVSRAALETCQQLVGDLCVVDTVCSDWLEGLGEIDRNRDPGGRLLLLFLGSSIGNIERTCVVEFLRSVRFHLREGDFFLIGADLIKNVNRTLAAYDDATGVTAAFNLNLLGRINRELDANFDLKSFAHDVRWNHVERRIEMHLVSAREQIVYSGVLDMSFHFRAGETIWTESSHKFTQDELITYARESGFEERATWTDAEWPFAETLWQAV